MASKIDPRLRDDDGAETPAIKTTTQPANTKAYDAAVSVKAQTTVSRPVKFSELQARYG